MVDERHPWDPPGSLPADDYVRPTGPPPACKNIRTVRDLLGPSFPPIVCLIGSTRFKADFEAAAKRETLAGRIVLTVGFFGHCESAATSRDVKEGLDELHLRKIDLADEVLVLNVGGYIGKSTGNELAYALARGTPVRTLEPLDLEAWRAERSRQANATAMKNVARNGRA